jgi:hypothetical protein
MILIVTYDLKTPRDYHDFYEAVKNQGRWWRYMASSWILATDKTPQQVCDAIQQFIDPQDSLLVCELKGNYQGRLPKQAWDWLNTELGQSTLPPEFWKNILAGGLPPAPAPAGIPSGTSKLSDLLGSLSPPPDLPKK